MRVARGPHGRLWRLYRRARRAGRRKRAGELAYWRSRQAAEGVLDNSHYEAVFTGLVGLDPSFYAAKAVLDVGCGPRGSLVWARSATRRVGLDPLVEEYRMLGIDEHPMEYVAARAEEMPFEDGAFDVVTSFNSLDHVDDLAAAIAEIKRVMRSGGHLVLAVEVGHRPTWTEPQMLGWDIWREFEPELALVAKEEYERGTGSMYERAFRRERFDHADARPRAGVLTAVMRKR